MKIKRIISIILVALLMTSLCAFGIGCKPSGNKEQPLSELEQAKANAMQTYNDYDKKYKKAFDEYKKSGERQYEGNSYKLLLNELSYNMLCDYFAELQKTFKESIESAENPDQIREAKNSFIERTLNRGVTYVRNPFDFFAMVQKFYKQVVFNVDGETLLLTNGLPNHSSNGAVGAFYFNAGAQDFWVECISEQQLWIEGNRNSSNVIKSGGSLEFKSPEGDQYDYFDFIVYKKKEIVGYAIYDFTKMDFSTKEILKAVTFEKEDRAKLTREKVLSYIASAKQGKDGAETDGIVSVICYENDIFNVFLTELYTWHSDTENQYNELKFLWAGEETGQRVYKIISRGGTFLYNGNKVNRATITENGSIYWDKETTAEGYIEIYATYKHRKNAYDEYKNYVDEMMIIKIDKADEVKKAKVLPVSFTGAWGYDRRYFTMEMAECSAKTVERMMEEGRIEI